MKRAAADLQTRLYASAVIVLIVGVCGAVLIYFTTGDDSDTAGGAYQMVIVNGKAYPIAAAESKTYVRDLRRFGGKAAVLFDEFNRWFAGLWRGKSLAVTVGWIAVFLSAGLFLLAHFLSPGASPEGGDRDGQG